MLRPSTVVDHENEWLYVFKPTVAATVLYLKVAIRQHCIVVSLHEDEEEQ